MTTYGLDSVNAALDSIITPLPDTYTYADRARDIGLAFDPEDNICEYSHNGTPACLVGMVYTGLTGEVIKESFPWDSPWQASTDHSVIFSEEANVFLTHVQRWQDRGYSWSESVVRTRAGDFDYYATPALWHQA